MDTATWLDVAWKELRSGVAEIAGSTDNTRIEEYLQTVGIRDPNDEIPWCAAFVNWCLKEVGLSGTGKPNARSFLDWGIVEPSESVRLGTITVLWRGERNAWTGHVGFLVGRSAGAAIILGGNQSDAVTVQGYPINRVLGYRWPGRI